MREVNKLTDIIRENPLPDWDELPQLELYMDQVIILVARYLSNQELLPTDEKPVTPAMINNYVKMGLVAPPVKKKYNRSQVACIIMICVLKRSLTMSAIQDLFPPDMAEDDIEKLYGLFRRSRASAVEYAEEQIRKWNEEFLEIDGDDNDEAFIISLAVMAGLFRSSAEKLIADR